MSRGLPKNIFIRGAIENEEIAEDEAARLLARVNPGSPERRNTRDAIEKILTYNPNLASLFFGETETPLLTYEKTRPDIDLLGMADISPETLATLMSLRKLDPIGMTHSRMLIEMLVEKSLLGNLVDGLSFEEEEGLPRKTKNTLIVSAKGGKLITAEITGKIQYLLKDVGTIPEILDDETDIRFSDAPFSLTDHKARKASVRRISGTLSVDIEEIIVPLINTVQIIDANGIEIHEDRQVAGAIITYYRDRGIERDTLKLWSVEIYDSPEMYKAVLEPILSKADRYSPTWEDAIRRIVHHYGKRYGSSSR